MTHPLVEMPDVPSRRSTGERLGLKRHDETRTAARWRLVAGGRAVMLCDLADQRQAEPPAARRLAAARRPVERLEHTLALTFRNSRSMVAYPELDAFAGARDRRRDGRRAVPQRILHQVAHEASDELRVALHCGDRPAD